VRFEKLGGASVVCWLQEVAGDQHEDRFAGHLGRGLKGGLQSSFVFSELESIAAESSIAESSGMGASSAGFGI